MIKVPLHDFVVCLALAALAVAGPTPGKAQTIAGDALAVDGDSLEVAGKRVRLFGIDAPELDQTCEKDGSTWPCGEAAKAQLAELIAGQQVECRGQDVDQFGRMLAVCSVRYDEINRILVAQGWALAFRQFSDGYVADELRAKTNRRGIWASHFALPRDYRHAKLPPGAAVRRRSEGRAAASVTIGHGWLSDQGQSQPQGRLDLSPSRHALLCADEARSDVLQRGGGGRRGIPAVACWQLKWD